MNMNNARRVPRRTAFFDMDGTLVAPLFKTQDGTMVTGLPGDEWAAFCDRTREHAYDDCPTVLPVMSYAVGLATSGWNVRILTIHLCEAEKLAKKEWLSRKGRHLTFSAIDFARDREDKVRIILDYAASNGLKPDDCLLVEDDLTTVLLAAEAGIRTMHLSNVIAGGYDVAARD